jgi:hypothetical protein
MKEIAQLLCTHERCTRCDLPLSLYSVFCFSTRSIDFGGAVALKGFSATPEAGRAFSSCLRNGLRMIGIVKSVSVCCGKCVQERCCSCGVRMVFVSCSCSVLSAECSNTQCDGRQVAQRRWLWRLSGPDALSDGRNAASSEEDGGEKRMLGYMVCWMGEWEYAARLSGCRGRCIWKRDGRRLGTRTVGCLRRKGGLTRTDEDCGLRTEG